jgi:hypothetical protein
MRRPAVRHAGQGSSPSGILMEIPLLCESDKEIWSGSTNVINVWMDECITVCRNNKQIKRVTCATKSLFATSYQSPAFNRNVGNTVFLRNTVPQIFSKKQTLVFFSNHGKTP